MKLRRSIVSTVLISVICLGANIQRPGAPALAQTDASEPHLNSTEGPAVPDYWNFQVGWKSIHFIYDLLV
jgi:hypothetical protein